MKVDRLQREAHTIEVMLEIYCRGHHRPRGALCAECQTLQAYALERLAKCPYHDAKPTCGRCTIHCYKPAMRAQVRQVMRFAGPRMVLSHPWLALLHAIDELTRPRKPKVDVKSKG